MALIEPDAIEKWECGAFFNPGPTLRVIVKGRKRFDMATTKAVTVADLKAKVYSRTHVLNRMEG